MRFLIGMVFCISIVFANSAFSEMAILDRQSANDYLDSVWLHGPDFSTIINYRAELLPAAVAVIESVEYDKLQNAVIVIGILGDINDITLVSNVLFLQPTKNDFSTQRALENTRVSVVWALGYLAYRGSADANDFVAVLLDPVQNKKYEVGANDTYSPSAMALTAHLALGYAAASFESSNSLLDLQLDKAQNGELNSLMGQYAIEGVTSAFEIRNRLLTEGSMLKPAYDVEN